jgi:hypothetical protein
MKENRIEEGRFTEHGHGLGTVTEEMVWQRARELARIAGRPEGQVLDSDLKEARRELTGQERLNPPATVGETIPEENRWEAVRETPSHRAPTVPAPDEQTFAEELVEEGVEEAEHDQMVQAERKGRREEKNE